jgi:hypothetical protein
MTTKSLRLVRLYSRQAKRLNGLTGMCLFLESRKGRASTDESWDRMEGPLVMSKKVGGREPKKIGEVGGAASARSLVVSGASKVAANARPGPVVEGRVQ